MRTIFRFLFRIQIIQSSDALYVESFKFSTTVHDCKVEWLVVYRRPAAD